jgi:hypothetical protein
MLQRQMLHLVACILKKKWLHSIPHIIENKLIGFHSSKTVWSNVYFIESHLIESPHERKQNLLIEWPLLEILLIQRLLIKITYDSLWTKSRSIKWFSIKSHLIKWFSMNLTSNYTFRVNSGLSIKWSIRCCWFSFLWSVAEKIKEKEKLVQLCPIPNH